MQSIIASGDGLDRLDLILGTAGDDHLTGTGLNDTVKGGDGDDTISGGDGDDLLLGGKGDDVLTDWSGSNTLDGGGGTDLADLAVPGDLEHGGLIDLSHFKAGRDFEVPNGVGGTNLLRSIELIEVDGGPGNDTIIGSRGADIILTGRGADSIQAGGGDDAIYDGGGDSTINGGAGDDRFKLSEDHVSLGYFGGHDVIDGGGGEDLAILDWYFQMSDVVVTLKNGRLHASNFEGGLTVDGARIEHLSITAGNGADILEGWNLADTLIGGAGNDSIQGGGGDDLLGGGVGNDTIEGGGGNDLYLWGDMFVIGPMLVDASGFDASGGSIVMTDPFGGQDTISGMEGVALYGGIQEQTLIGSSGSDRLIGLWGEDSLVGGAGDDLFVEAPLADILVGQDSVWGQGDDTLDGGDGLDTVSYALDPELGNTASTAMLIDLRAGTAVSEVTGHDTLISIEHVIAGDADDTLIGGRGVDILEGGGGDDMIIAGTGPDRMIGGDGADLFVFRSFTDEIKAQGYDVVADLEAGDVIDLSAIDADPAKEGDQAFRILAKFHDLPGEMTLNYDFIAEVTSFYVDLDQDGQVERAFAVAGDHREDYASFLVL